MDRRKSDFGPLDAQLDVRRTWIHDTAKKCALLLEAYPFGDVDDVAAFHFLSLCETFRALLALASHDLDDITNGFDDSMALQDLSLTGKLSALLDVKITIQANECWYVLAFTAAWHRWPSTSLQTGPKNMSTLDPCAQGFEATAYRIIHSVDGRQLVRMAGSSKQHEQQEEDR